MAERAVEPVEVARMVESFASDEHNEAARWSNREVLDESGIYNLHTLAARIYALGFNDGVSVEGWKRNEQRQRIRDAARPAEEPT